MPVVRISRVIGKTVLRMWRNRHKCRADKQRYRHDRRADSQCRRGKTILHSDSPGEKKNFSEHQALTQTCKGLAIRDIAMPPNESNESLTI